MYHKHTHFHLIGCNTLGMVSIALLLRSYGYTVSGCDTSLNPAYRESLEEAGCIIYSKHDSHHLCNTQVIVHPTEIDRTIDELKNAKSHNKTVISQAALLGELMRKAYGITVTGSHSKTNTSALITHILRDTGNDPTFVLESTLKNYHTHAYAGKGDWFVTQASPDSTTLSHVTPTIALVTNIEANENNTITHMLHTISSFIDKLPFYGIVVLNKDDAHSKQLINTHQKNCITFGFNKRADVYGEVVTLTSDYSIFNVYNKEQGLLGSITLPHPGVYAIQAALGATTICHQLLGIPFSKISKACSKFSGVERRFELKGTYNNASVIDDYAQHPSQINATLTIARSKTNKKLHIIFQPHLYKNYEHMCEELITVFSKHADNIDTLHILHTSEKDLISQVFSQTIMQHCPTLKIYYYQNKNELTEAIKYFLGPGDVLVTLGDHCATEVGTQLIASDDINSKHI